jgi:hypothetical protein
VVEVRVLERTNKVKEIKVVRVSSKDNNRVNKVKVIQLQRDFGEISLRVVRKEMTNNKVRVIKNRVKVKTTKDRVKDKVSNNNSNKVNPNSS